MINSKVLICDLITKTSVLYEIENRIAKGVYQLKDYPSVTYLFDPEDEAKLTIGENVVIHPDEVTMKMYITHTKGNIIIENIKVGDIHYEYEYGCGIKVEVLTLPVREGDYWSWKSKCISTGEEIDYGVTAGLSHYGPNLYDYEAYSVSHMV